MNYKTETHNRVRSMIMDIAHTTGIGFSHSDLANAILDGIRHSHRTEQQQMIAALVETVIGYAGERYYDPRNEDAVRLARDVKDALAKMPEWKHGIAVPYL